MSETKTYRILFQGDSITDVGRARNDPRNMGQGYPVMVAGELGLRFPGKYEFINRGISGDRIPDLVARFGKDFVHLKPDVISILVGVNDVWHEPDVRNRVDRAAVPEPLPDAAWRIFSPPCGSLRRRSSLWSRFFLPAAPPSRCSNISGRRSPCGRRRSGTLRRNFPFPLSPCRKNLTS